MNDTGSGEPLVLFFFFTLASNKTVIGVLIGWLKI
jgi:hypothetical protein